MAAEQRPVEGLLIADKQAARRLFTRLAEGWSDPSEPPSLKQSLARHFISSHLDRQLHRDSDKADRPEISTAIAFAARVAETMAFKKDVIDKSAAGLASIVRGLSANAELKSPVTLLDTSGQDGETAAVKLAVALQTISELGLDHAFHITESETITGPDGRNGAHTKLPLPGGRLLLELSEFPASDSQQSEIQLAVSPISKYGLLR